MLGNFKYQCVYNYSAFIGITIEEQAVLIVNPYSIYTIHITFLLLIVERLNKE